MPAKSLSQVVPDVTYHDMCLFLGKVTLFFSPFLIRQLYNDYLEIERLRKCRNDIKAVKRELL